MREAIMPAEDGQQRCPQDIDDVMRAIAPLDYGCLVDPFLEAVGRLQELSEWGYAAQRTDRNVRIIADMEYTAAGFDRKRGILTGIGKGKTVTQRVTQIGIWEGR
jgi:hypothetical protein